MIQHYETYQALKDIASRDPDGGEIEPTVVAYDQHRAWAVNAYGQHVWEIYVNGHWDTPEV